MTAAKPKRGRCRYCGRRTALTTRGLVRAHMIIAGPTTLAPGKRVWCGGGGQVPQ